MRVKTDNMHAIVVIIIINIQLCASELCTDPSKVYNTSLIDVGDSISLGFKISCSTNTITFKLSGPSDKWFGIVFSKEMHGDAIIYTTGKSNDNPVKLYDYWLEDNNIDDVTFDAQQHLTEIEQTVINETVHLTYTRSLSTNDDKDKYFDSETITFRYAFGTGLKLEKHTPQHRSKEILSIDLNTGKLTEKQDIKWVLHVVHGVLMWIIWAVLVPLTIFIARNRHLWNENDFHVPMVDFQENDAYDVADISVDTNQWFKLHRAIGIIIVK